MSEEVAGAQTPCPHCGEEHPASALKCPSTDLVLPLEGRVLAGRFQLVRELGTGGMASVWLALNTAVDRLVAIKLIRAEVVRRTETVARFRSEARAAGRIDHPNICQIHDFGSSPIGPYMVMEYLRGHNLAEILAGGHTLPVGVATGLMTLALSGLAAAHREGIVHRDLKPENIFIHMPENGPPGLKLMDFGVSKLTDGSGEIQTEHGALLGTPEYMAPEQVGGAASVDARCDLWAVGAMLYRALTGRLPFKGPTIAATLLDLTNTEPRAIESLAPDVPEALCELVMQCLSKERTGRPADAEALTQALVPWAEPVDLVAMVQRARNPAPMQVDASSDKPSENPAATSADTASRKSDAGSQAAPAATTKRKAAVSQYPTLKRANGTSEDVSRGVDDAAPKEDRDDELERAVGTVARLAAEARALRDGPPGQDAASEARLGGEGDGPDEPAADTAHPANPTQSRTWLLPAIVLLVGVGLAWFFFGRDGESAQAAVDSAGITADHRDTTAARSNASTGSADSASPIAPLEQQSSSGEPASATQAASTTSAETGEDLIVMDDVVDTTGTDGGGDGSDGPGAEPPSERVHPHDTKSAAPSAGPDPGGTFRVGAYLVLSGPGPITTHSAARKYCKRLATTAHLGISKWTLPNPAAARLVGASKKLKLGRYWTSARHKGRARVLAMPRAELDSEAVDRKRVRALCIARSPRGQGSG